MLGIVVGIVLGMVLGMVADKSDLFSLYICIQIVGIYYRPIVWGEFNKKAV